MLLVLKTICAIGYVHVPELAPIQDILAEYKKHKGDRAISEDKPHHCHRRLIAEHVKAKWGDMDIIHIL